VVVIHRAALRRIGLWFGRVLRDELNWYNRGNQGGDEKSSDSHVSR
jgi:hypothetical protein